MDTKIQCNEETTAPAQAYNINPAFPRPVQVARSPGWFQTNQRNKPQANSAGAASLILITGGMQLVWGFGYTIFESTASLHMRISWFIAVIIGALNGAVLCNVFQKKIIFMGSAILVILGGILGVTLSTYIDAVVVLRYINGIANGLAWVATIIISGEESVKAKRGQITSSIEALCLSLGIMLGTLYSYLYTPFDHLVLDLIQIEGILNILFGVISFLCAYFLTIESPIYYLTRSQEVNAIDVLRRLQRPTIVTTETYEQFEEHKRYIASNRELSIEQNAIAALPALFKLCIYRGMVALTVSMIVIRTILELSWDFSGSFSSWSLILCTLLRWAGVFFAVFMMDSIGRKNPMLFSAFIAAGLIIAFGALSQFSDGFEVALYLMFIFQIFAGIFITASSVYLSEAFPLAVKSYYIAISISFEMLVHIIVIAYADNVKDISVYFYTLGALLIAFVGFGRLCLPETKQTTLREAQDRFQKFFSPRN